MNLSTSDGRYRPPPAWLAADEIERLVETEVDRAGQTPTMASPVTDVERFLEGHLHAELDQYAPLPPGVLGLTRFRPGKSPQVLISSDLAQRADNEPASTGARGRWRATLAHEGAGHILLHQKHFDRVAAQTQAATLGAPVDEAGFVQCLDQDLGAPENPSSKVDRWEWQANRGMGALLMPRTIFTAHAVNRIGAHNMGRLVLGTLSANVIVADLAELFEVSKQAAAIRLQTLGLAHQAPAAIPIPLFHL